MMWKLDVEPFVGPLRKAYADGKFPKERLSDMVRRILRSAYAVGIDKWGPAPAVDMARHNEIALEIARQGIVLLKNDGALPLATDKPLKIAVIGGYAQQGVISGTGSGAVAPVGGFAAVMKIGGAGIMDITDGKPAYINFTKHLIINPPPVDPQHLVIEVLEDVLTGLRFSGKLLPRQLLPGYPVCLADG